MYPQCKLLLLGSINNLHIGPLISNMFNFNLQTYLKLSIPIKKNYILPLTLIPLYPHIIFPICLSLHASVPSTERRSFLRSPHHRLDRHFFVQSLRSSDNFVAPIPTTAPIPLPGSSPSYPLSLPSAPPLLHGCTSSQGVAMVSSMAEDRPAMEMVWAKGRVRTMGTHRHRCPWLHIWPVGMVVTR